MDSAAVGKFPSADFSSTHLPSPTSAADGVFGYFGHHVLASDVDPDWVDTWTKADPFAFADVRFLAALAVRLQVSPGIYDAVYAAPGLGQQAHQLDFVPFQNLSHPRVHRALAYRDPTTVEAYAPVTGGGVLVLGRGVAGRMEAAFEVDETHRGSGMGKLFVKAARALAPQGESVFVQVSPGNVWSMRAVASDPAWRPVGSEILYHRQPDPKRLR